MLPSGLPEHVDDDEDLARFLVQRNQFNDNFVKPAAFLPNPKDKETSVSRHGRHHALQLWTLGCVAAGDRTLYGAAILKARIARKAELDVSSAEPPPRHAVIRGWPWIVNDLELQKAKQKEIAVVLAAAVGKPFLRPPNEVL